MDDRETLAALVRDACARAAAAAYEDAGVRGLCGEGRWEIALEAIRRLDLADVLTPPAEPGETDRSRA